MDWKERKEREKAFYFPSLSCAESNIQQQVLSMLMCVAEIM